MCTNPHAAAAKIEKEKRDYIYRSNALKFHNKEASWQMAHDRNVIGFSRAKSDIYSRSLDIIGQGRKLGQEAEREYYVQGSVAKSAEGGRSRTAGRNDYLALLAKQSQIESKIGRTLGRGAASASQGILRQYQNKVASNRQKLGLPPEYGPTVFEQQQSPWQRIQPVVQFAQTAMSFFPTS